MLIAWGRPFLLFIQQERVTSSSFFPFTQYSVKIKLNEDED